MEYRKRGKQAWTIAKIELRRAFLSKRAFWVYALALFPTIIFFFYGVHSKYRRADLSSHAMTTPALMDSVREGETAESVLQRLGKTSQDTQWPRRFRPRPKEGPPFVHEMHRRLAYFDGYREARFEFINGGLTSKQIQPLLNFEEDRQGYARVFHYYLRLAIFFGCLGIFMNLFRGEMLDKTLHFWFLVPAQRQVLLAGKYGAGLIASTVIFTGGTMLSFGVMLWPHNPVEVQAYWQGFGMAHLFWYAVAAAMGCIGYGSVFLAAGLLMRNPIIPAIVIVGWESINGYLPEVLQKASVLYYLQSLCPVPLPVDKDASPLLQLLLTPAAPASRIGAIFGLLAVTALVLWIARIAILRMQVTYSTEV
jgi:hypothetical protein